MWHLASEEDIHLKSDQINMNEITFILCDNSLIKSKTDNSDSITNDFMANGTKTDQSMLLKL